MNGVDSDGGFGSMGDVKRKVELDDSPDSFGSHKKRRGNLPKASTNLLKKWLFDHLVNIFRGFSKVNL